ncbi:MAG: hypothetical protein ACTHN8_13195 [Angustibacter sp.]
MPEKFPLYLVLAVVADVAFWDTAFDEGAQGSQRHRVRAQVLTPDGGLHAGAAAARTRRHRW